MPYCWSPSGTPGSSGGGGTPKLPPEDGGVSHFYAELRRLKQVVDAADASSAVLFLLDEILHGTNSRERIVGARSVVASLVRKGAIGAVSSHDLGLTVVRLHPGGTDRVNPMEAGGGDQDGSVIARQNLAAQLVVGVLGRELSPLEDAVLGWAIERRCQSPVPFTLRDLCAEILDPPDELVRLSRHSPLELARATSPVTFALDKLCSRTLRGSNSDAAKKVREFSRSIARHAAMSAAAARRCA